MDKQTLMRDFRLAFGREPKAFFSAPGRTELGGNHTDHQHGCVLAAAVNLETVAAVAENGTDCLRLRSVGYEACQVSLADLAPRPEELGTTAALLRGVAAGFSQHCTLYGLDIYVMSQVLPGSGLSSSAAFEVLLGTIFNCLYNEERLDAISIAKIGQYAENAYFGKPCGLMDQLASALGGAMAIDFENLEQPLVQKLPFDPRSAGYELCIVDSGADHAGLTAEYAAIAREMQRVCSCFGKCWLRQVPETEFYTRISQVRERCGDRAVLRAIHVYEENKRVCSQREALLQGDFCRFLTLVRESGRSSWMYLQNIVPGGSVKNQALALTLALCERLLEGNGACRVHGGGFGGTVQAFVPLDRIDGFQASLEAVLGNGCCHVLEIRDTGGCRIESR